MDQMKGTEEGEKSDLSNWRNGTETGNSGEGANLRENIQLSPDTRNWRCLLDIQVMSSEQLDK